MKVDARLDLIKRNLQEVIGEEELVNLLSKKKNPIVYWGTMPTGSPHVAYFLPLLKLRDFLNAGLTVKVLIADLHAALDGVSWQVLKKRQKYYEALIPLMLQALDVELKRLEFVKGSKIQLQPKYFEDLLKMNMHVHVKDATKAASEVVKMDENPKLGNLIYPLMQALDEEYLKADIQFGGLDQRKIFVFAREYLPKIGYGARVELMNPMIPGLVGKKMSASIPSSKIDVLDDSETIIRKLREAECEPGNADNGVMAFLKYVIFTLKGDKKEKLTIERQDKFGGNVRYTDYADLERDFIAKKLHPLDIKNALGKEIIALLAPIQKNRKSLEKLYKEAYTGQNH
ncbi:MAG: tyrosine--tRNA ligase [Nanoarchaeota archaeon]